MAHQEALTIVTKIKPSHIENLKKLLGHMNENVEANDVIPFGQFEDVHFARFVVFDDARDLKGNVIPATLAYLVNVDAPSDRYLDHLVDVAGDGLDEIYSHCEAYPDSGKRTRESRLDYLRTHRVDSQVFYVNRIGRTVRQIRREAQLRDAIGEFLDGRDWSGHAAMDVRKAIQDFVDGEPSLQWAKSAPPAPEFSWRLKEKLHLIAVPLGVLLLLPLIILLLPIAAILLRIHEKNDVPDESKASPKRIRELLANEDLGVQNEIIAIGAFKPGWFRRITTTLVLAIADYAVRHIYTRGQLSGLETIHFARWVTVDEGRRLFFSSNYDGSLESYMNDFIDKAAWGLNAIFSNGDGFPRTRWLFFDGIKDEQAYKNFLPTRRVFTPVWYSAYPQLTAANVNNNSEIRAGLYGSLSRGEVEAWLRRL